MARRNNRSRTPQPQAYQSSPRLFIPPPHRSAGPVECALEDAPDLVAREADLPAVRAARAALPSSPSSPSTGPPTLEEAGPLLGAVIPRDTKMRAVSANNGAPHLSVLIGDLDEAEAAYLAEALDVRAFTERDRPSRWWLVAKRRRALDLLAAAADHLDEDSRARAAVALADLDTLRARPC